MPYDVMTTLWLLGELVKAVGPASLLYVSLTIKRKQIYSVMLLSNAFKPNKFC